VTTRVGPYAIERELGRGAAGAVFRARAADGAPVALKLLFGSAAEPTRRRRFQTEVKALGRLRHRGVVRVLDHGEHEGRPYLVMELVEGASLEDRLERVERLPPAEAARVAEDVARALAHAHAAGVVHRDVKPGNVLLAPDRAARLTDFGLALDLDASQSRLSKTGMLLGSPAFWAPEQAHGRLDAMDARTDVYGVGGLLYAGLTGRPPCSGGSLAEAIAALEAPLVRPRELTPDVDPELERICLRCLEKAPEDRYPSAEALAADLAAWRLGRPLRGRRRGPAAAVAVAVVAAGGLAAAAIVAAGRSATPPDPTATPAGAATGDVSAEPPDPARPLLKRAAAALDADDVEAALAAFEEALALDPDRAKAHAGKAVALDRSGRTAAAGVAARRALELDPDVYEGHLVLGKVATSAGDTEAALAAFSRAAASEDDDGLAPWCLALLHEHRGDLSAALAAMDDALAKRPERVEWLRFRADLRARVGDATGTVEDAERIAALDPGPGSLRELAVARWTAGDARGALADARRAVALGADAEPRAWAVQAAALEALGDLRGARAAAERALALDPPGEIRLQVLGVLLNVAGALEDLEALVAAADAILRLDPDRHMVRYNRAAARGRLDDVAGALADYDRFLAAVPDSADAYYNRGRLLLEEGRPADALRDLDRCLELEPGAGDVLSLRGEARLALGDRRGAQVDLEACLRASPPNAAWVPDVRRELAALQADLAAEDR